MKRVVRDFYRGAKIFAGSLFFGFLLTIMALSLVEEYGNEFILPSIILVALLLLPIILSIRGFFVNYTPVKVINNNVFIPASDQLRTFTDLITINPISGLYRKRVYNTNEIENVANGYTNVKRGKEKEWNVVITGMKNGKSFSQRIDCSNKQVRDEVRNVLKKTITGKVNSDFAI